MTKDETVKSVARRAFFRKAGMAAVGAAAFGLGGGLAQGATESNRDKREAAGYRETEHVKKVYRLSRF